MYRTRENAIANIDRSPRCIGHLLQAIARIQLCSPHPSDLKTVAHKSQSATSCMKAGPEFKQGSPKVPTFLEALQLVLQKAGRSVSYYNVACRLRSARRESPFHLVESHAMMQHSSRSVGLMVHSSQLTPL
jgi:hypothetical protein